MLCLIIRNGLNFSPLLGKTGQANHPLIRGIKHLKRIRTCETKPRPFKLHLWFFL